MRVVAVVLLTMISALGVPAFADAADGLPQVVIRTSMGDITLELDEKAAPVTVANFLRYVDEGAYNNTIFHRVIPGFMIQGGGHYADLSEAPEKEPIRNEADNGLRNDKGTIAMARMNKIDSAGRQFFINVANNEFLNHSSKSCTREDEAQQMAALARGIRRPATCDSFGYAVFGRVVSGMEVAELIELTETKSVGPYQDVPITPVVILAVERVAGGAENADSEDAGAD